MTIDTHARRMLPSLGLIALAVPALAFPAFAGAAPADTVASTSPSATSAATAPEAAVVATESAAASAGIAPPTTSEQIDRADGQRGATTLKSLITAEPVFASDDGRVGAYSGGPSTINLTFAPVSTVVRDAVASRSTDLGTVAGKLLQVDRSETIGLFRQRIVDLEANTVVTSYSVARLDGRGPVRDLGIDYQYATVVLSGNGKYVIASTNDGLRRLNLATGVWTMIATFGAIEPRSVSDDGLTIAAVDFNPDTQEIASVVFRGAKPTRTVLVAGYPYAGNGTGPQLSPDGSTVVSFKPQLLEDQPPKVSVQNLATGKVVETGIPYANAYDARPVWISPSGDRVAFALGTQYQGFGDPLQPAKVLNVRTGKWSTFGGAFATSIKGSPTTLTMPSAISRNGQYAVVEYNSHAALVSLEGRPLPGSG
ncbi:MAG: hypothetical protein Q7T55_06015, partial [Solirubrobacteraceae bacterium]|nr:hypothetical protein [Solirubrobacteraceae bacterium]